MVLKAYCSPQGGPPKGWPMEPSALRGREPRPGPEAGGSALLPAVQRLQEDRGDAGAAAAPFGEGGAVGCSLHLLLPLPLSTPGCRPLVAADALGPFFPIQASQMQGERRRRLATWRGGGHFSRAADLSPFSKEHWTCTGCPQQPLAVLHAQKAVHMVERDLCQDFSAGQGPRQEAAAARPQVAS